VVEAVDPVEVGHIEADCTAGIAEKMEIAEEEQQVKMVDIAGLAPPAA
jgi:hypothetical protein